MQQPIIDWRQDEMGDWVAVLLCGHGQHVRHAPPLSERPWVLSAEGRAGFIGFVLNCVRCDEELALAEGLGELTTERLIIRPFLPADLDAIHRILNAAFGADDDEHPQAGLARRQSWLTWNSLSAAWYPAMHEPPYGDRAVVLRATGQVLGSVGYVPLLMPFDKVPELARTPGPGGAGRMTAEVGLFWAIDPGEQGQGYATEAARALVAYAFRQLGLWRILATTEYDNLASQAVMRKLGMRLMRNPHPRPVWLQVVGVRYGPAADAAGPSQEGLLT